jgi:hypothetical protein
VSWSLRAKSQLEDLELTILSDFETRRLPRSVGWRKIGVPFLVGLTSPRGKLAGFFIYRTGTLPLSLLSGRPFPVP